jgi:hypothetical protein
MLLLGNPATERTCLLSRQSASWYGQDKRGLQKAANRVCMSSCYKLTANNAILRYSDRHINASLNQTNKCDYCVSRHYPSSWRFLFKTQNVPKTAFCLRLQVKPTQLGPFDRASPYLRGWGLRLSIGLNSVALSPEIRSSSIDSAQLSSPISGGRD